MKNIRWTLVALLLLAAPQISQAQTPTDPAMEGAGSTTTTAAGNLGSVDSGTISTSSTTTTNTMTTGISPDATAEVTPMDDSTGMASTEMSDSGALPNTGGEPVLMTLTGLAIAAAAFGMRRKVTA